MHRVAQATVCNCYNVMQPYTVFLQLCTIQHKIKTLCIIQTFCVNFTELSSILTFLQILAIYLSDMGLAIIPMLVFQITLGTKHCLQACKKACDPYLPVQFPLPSVNISGNAKASNYMTQINIV